MFEMNESDTHRYYCSEAKWTGKAVAKGARANSHETGSFLIETTTAYNRYLRGANAFGSIVPSLSLELSILIPRYAFRV